MEKDRFEKICRKADMRPVARVSTPHGEILIAEGFRNDNLVEFPWGYFRTLWVVDRNGLDIGRHLDFNAFHDPEFSVEDRKMARINSAKSDALGWINTNVDMNRYDH